MADIKGSSVRGATGLEYKRTVDEVDEQKQRISASIERMYSIASYVFAIGLIAVGALCVISFLNNTPKIAIACEIIVFICLILLLILIGRARRRIAEQRSHSERYPYKSVNRKEIDSIFDLIADEEKKRERLDRFAMSNSSKITAPSAYSAEKKEEKVSRSEPEPKEVPVSNIPVPEQKKAEEKKADEPEEDSGIIHIFPMEEEEMVSVLDDELDSAETKKETSSKKEEAPEPEPDKEEKEAEQAVENNSDEDAESSGEPQKKKRPKNPDGTRQAPSGKRPPQGSRPKKRPNGEAGASRDPRAQQRSRDGSANGTKKRRPPAYDPYYGGGYYYDEYGRPIRRAPPYDPYYGGYYYDEYGQPVRRRESAYGQDGSVVYDEYGRPVRRRPPQGYDPRREEAMRRKRAAAGADPTRRRPDVAKSAQTANGQSAGPAKQSKATGPQPAAESRRTAAPVAMPSLKKDFDEEHIAVSIPDFDDDYDYDANRGRVPLRADRQQAAGSKQKAAPPKPVVVDETEYSPRDVEAVPIIIPDDDYYSRYEDEEQAYAAPSKSKEPSMFAPPPKKNVPDYQYDAEELTPEERDTGVVIVPDFDSFDDDSYEDRYAHGRYRNSSGTDGAAEKAYQPPVKQDRQSANAAVEENDYSYEDEGVVVLPHDEGYESYLEKVKQEEEQKRIEERKLARKQSGKIALTIRKVRRKKIRRMSRKYKRFRASVIPLAKYLSSYDN